MLTGYVLAKETVIEIEGQRPELGYTVHSRTGVFETSKEVTDMIKEFNLPLGWVALPVSAIFNVY